MSRTAQERPRRFGYNLKAAREAARVSDEERRARHAENRRLDGPLTQLELARRMKLKSQSNIAMLEKSDLPPTPEKVIKLAMCLECHTAELMHDVIDVYAPLRKEPPDRKGLSDR